MINGEGHLKVLDVELAGLTNAQGITLRTDKVCYLCGENIKSGDRCITATHKVDKKFNKTYKELYDRSELESRPYNFISERHWLCLGCANKEIETLKLKYELSTKDWEERIDIAFEKFESGELDVDELLDISFQSCDDSVKASEKEVKEKEVVEIKG